MNYFKYTLIVLFFLNSFVAFGNNKNKIEQFSIEGWKILKIGMNFGDAKEILDTICNFKSKPFSDNYEYRNCKIKFYDEEIKTIKITKYGTPFFNTLSFIWIKLVDKKSINNLEIKFNNFFEYSDWSCQNITKDLPDGATAGAIIGGILGNQNSTASNGTKLVCNKITRYKESMETIYSHSTITFNYDGKTYTVRFNK